MRNAVVLSLIVLVAGCGSTGTKDGDVEAAKPPTSQCTYCHRTGICPACDDAAKCPQCEGSFVHDKCEGKGCEECRLTGECPQCTPMGVVIDCEECGSTRVCPHCTPDEAKKATGPG